MAEKTKNAQETAALKLVDIVKTYGEGENAVRALKGISISFRKNEFVSILGPSGCGKTTMLNIIGGLDRYTSGDLIINGVSTKEYKDRDWDTYRNNSIGFVFQNYNLIPHQTVLSNVELALTLSGVSKAERHKKAKEVLDKVGLTDQAHKKPNQLSGGQMQRVAIARALVNDPEIILADEPTGALDTETSIQVLDLLKEVARDRLVIMVTHNPDLAKKYSTRIINLLDGEKIGDTDEFIASDEISSETVGDGVEVKTLNKKGKKNKRKGKAAMKLTTAFALSFSNLLTKKGRTILTSIAGSIGIIGIALVLAVSTGFSAYIQRLQSETLSVYPVTITEATIDLEEFQALTDKEISDDELKEKIKQQGEQSVYTRDMFGDLTNMLSSNNITKEYLAYLDSYVETENAKAKETDKQWAYSVKTEYGFDVNNYLYSEIAFRDFKFTMPIDQLVKYLERWFDEGVKNSNLGISSEFIRQYIPTLSEIPENSALLKSQYELIDEGGRWPEKEGELLLVVNKDNEISDITLALLGLRTIENVNKMNYSVEFGGDESISFADIKARSFYYVKNDNRYVKAENGNWYDTTFSSEFNEINPDLTLNITGVARIKEGIQSGVLGTGIAYTSAFKNRILNDNKLVYDENGKVDETNSPKIAVAAEKAGKNHLNMYSWYLAKDGEEIDVANSDHVMRDMYYFTFSLPAEQQSAARKTLFDLTLSYDGTIRSLAGDDTVSKVSIYSSGYEEKKALKEYLDGWNATHTREEERVIYSDSTELLFMALNKIVDAVKIVLVAFTSISLVVSSIMIGIITYVSVVERTKEIGVLRSLGARKKDISRIFNAETFLIGLFAGLIGVAVSYLLTIPINLIVGGLIENAGAIASLRVTDALILVVVSFALTLIAGIIPARIAAKKDPVVALRTE